jgi:hypothetical protein
VWVNQKPEYLMHIFTRDILLAASPECKLDDAFEEKLKAFDQIFNRHFPEYLEHFSCLHDNWIYNPKNSFLSSLKFSITKLYLKYYVGLRAQIYDKDKLITEDFSLALYLKDKNLQIDICALYNTNTNLGYNISGKILNSLHQFALYYPYDVIIKQKAFSVGKANWSKYYFDFADNYSLNKLKESFLNGINNIKEEYDYPITRDSIKTVREFKYPFEFYNFSNGYLYGGYNLGRHILVNESCNWDGVWKPEYIEATHPIRQNCDAILDSKNKTFVYPDNLSELISWKKLQR